MILNMAGGTMPLNFKVVGGSTKPTNYSPNTLWVNTPDAITGWSFNANAPFPEGSHIAIVETAGDYLSTYNNGTTTIIALKKNSGKAAKTGCKVTIGGVTYGGVMLVSPNPDACTIALNEASGTTANLIEYIGQIEYQGVTYYYAYHFDQKYLNNGSTWHEVDADSYEEIAETLAKIYAGDGMVWLKLDTTSEVSFNAVKKNELRVYPVAAYQYSTGAYNCLWNKKDLAINVDGEWVDAAPWDGVLYDSPNQYEDITGGWVKGEGNASTKIDASRMTLVTTSNSANRIHVETANAVDLTKFKTLYVNATISELALGSGISNIRCRLGYSSTKGANLASASTKVEKSCTAKGEVTLQLDISNVTGEKYIVFGIGYYSATVDVNKVWVV